MPRLKRLKQRLVHQAIEDNLDTMWALRRRQARLRKQRLRLWASRVGAAVVSPVLILGAFELVHAVSSGRVPGELVVAPTIAASTLPPRPREPQLPVPPAPRSTTVAIPEEARFEAPAPMDPAVFPLGIHRIIIDPGHGGHSPGTSYGNLVEKDIALDIGLRLRDLLHDASYQVVMTRETDETVSLQERAREANSSAGDIFVSIHLNWFPKRTSRGVETYYLGPTTDPALSEIAARENQDSGYSLADMKKLVEKVYLDARKTESEHLAEAVQNALVHGLRRVNPAVEDRGVKTAPFIVLVATEMPAILAEVSCLSHKQEAKLLADERYRQNIADALFHGIRAFVQAEASGNEKGA